MDREKREITLSPFGTRGFENNKDIDSILMEKTPQQLVCARQGAGGNSMKYLEGFRAIEIANAVFGYDGWSDEVKQFIPQNTGCVLSIVRITLKNGCYHEDIGFGSSALKNNPLEIAAKESVTDARKRALRLFGNLLGNSLYDVNYTRNISPNSTNKRIIIQPVNYTEIVSEVENSKKVIEEKINQSFK
ncbi:DNA repair and recombination protein rad52, putative [Entamoeba invadens IP1]|uniref:DNA repair and recombination protein rad52, putative n=1 Tax=Entamoeba invadens IP1 TaxID=370355 RepID=L7FN21_ENTIV|nr:DNA repair and recombination protein rad52, putative [Entamoeba invadens IP1]ELP87545.1 DNA repair and recombination protein rad52, putative [Entamoeba invadens IP1]|eukprot:XP_004254316.1 DNA repair and recombination protein rad52, putative [Entamoeba invadens IP1]